MQTCFVNLNGVYLIQRDASKKSVADTLDINAIGMSQESFFYVFID